MNMHIYGNGARFDESQRFLTEDEIRASAPSVFAAEAHASRSQRFAPIPTIEVVRALATEGFGVVGAKQAPTRDPGRQDFTKHLLRLRPMDGRQRQVGDTIFEILLKNANDGTAAYDLMSGLFRVRCLNSLVAMATQMETCRIRHSGDVAGKVIDATYRVIEDAERALTAPDQWSRVELSRPEQLALASSAHAVRFPVDEEDERPTTTVTAEQLLEVRRSGDQGRDLWTTFNVVQENALRGGIHYVTRDANNRRRRGRTRAVKGIDQSTALNRALWALGAETARLKAA